MNKQVNETNQGRGKKLCSMSSHHSAMSACRGSQRYEPAQFIYPVIARPLSAISK